MVRHGEGALPAPDEVAGSGPRLGQPAVPSVAVLWVEGAQSGPVPVSFTVVSTRPALLTFAPKIKSPP